MFRPLRFSVFLSGLLGVVLALSGCMMLGPDYEEPPVEWLDSLSTNLYGTVSAAAEEDEPDLSFWWKLFDDPVLNRLIELARKENPSLQIAGLRILESRASLGIAESTLYPQLKQASGSTAYVETRRRGGDLPNSNNSMTTYQTGLGLGWELDFWGKFRRSIESADAAFFSSIANQQDIQVLLSAQVADLYYSYRTLLLRIQIAKENAEIQKRSYEITDQLYQSGEDSELDLQQAKTQYMSTLSSIPGIELSMIKTRNSLCALLGRAPGRLPGLDETATPLPVIEPAAVQAVPAQLMMRRPDVRNAAWQVAAQSAQIGVAKADLYPAVSLGGSVGWSGNSMGGSPDTLTLGIGPSFTWNLFDTGQIRNNVRVQDARLQQAIVNFENTVLQAAKEIDDAAISIVKTREQQDPQKKSTIAAKRALEIANVRYREGYADFQRVIDAQRSLVSQTEREVINSGNHLSAIISFYKALGGGWRPATLEEMLPAATLETMAERTRWGHLLDAPLPEEQPASTRPEDMTYE